ncbi:hypothetical protein FOCC_FOCC013849, partial [Frankliniella occidentalis]
MAASVGRGRRGPRGPGLPGARLAMLLQLHVHLQGQGGGVAGGRPTLAGPELQPTGRGAAARHGATGQPGLVQPARVSRTALAKD